MNQGCEAFIASENSHCIQRTLTNNIRTTGEIKYLTGDNDYYKRAANWEWHGPAKVLGQDGQQALLKHGSIYIWVHPYWLQLCSMQVNEQFSINKNQSENTDANDSNEIDTESDSEIEYADSQLQMNYQNCEVTSDTNNLLKPSETRSAQ